MVLLAVLFRFAQASECSELLIVAQGLKMDIIRPDIYAQVSTNCCNAQGVKCDTYPLVRELDWSNLGLNGTIISTSLPPGIFDINLSRNKITGTIPVDIAVATKVDFSHNKLSGAIPAIPTNVVNYDVSDNVLTGPVPASTLNVIQTYNVSNNKLTGGLLNPASTSLISYDASVNGFTGGLPGFVNSLLTLFVFNNTLTGGISSLPSLLVRFDASYNRFNGILGQFPTKLLYFKANDNALIGTLPVNLQLCTLLQNITLSNNKLINQLPALLPPNLLYLDLSNNLITNDVPTLPSSLISLNLGNNKFTGGISLQRPLYLSIGNNWITNITIKDASLLTPGSCDLSKNPLAFHPNVVNLNGICLQNSLFNSSFPNYTMPVDCPNLINLAQGLNLNNKQPFYWKALQTDCCTTYGIVCASQIVTQINWFSMGLNGVINGTAVPANLTTLQINSNSLTGPIPLAFPNSLVTLVLNNNVLSGSIPSTLPSNVVILYLQSNKLTGNIPSTLPSRLQYMYLHSNLLVGDIPLLPSTLQYIYLSNNRLTGTLRLNQPINLYINVNWITDVVIQDKSKITAASQCDLSNNPLLGNPNINGMYCNVNGLYSAMLLPNTITISGASTSTSTQLSMSSLSQLQGVITTNQPEIPTQITTTSTFIFGPIGSILTTTTSLDNFKTTLYPIVSSTTDMGNTNRGLEGATTILVTTTQIFDSSNATDLGTGGVVGFIGVISAILVVVIAIILVSYWWVLQKEKELKNRREQGQY